MSQKDRWQIKLIFRFFGKKKSNDDGATTANPFFFSIANVKSEKLKFLINYFKLLKLEISYLLKRKISRVIKILRNFFWKKPQMVA